MPMAGSKYTLFKTFLFIAVITGLLFTISSCNPLPNNGVPIYLQIDSPKVQVPLNSNLGSASYSIPGVSATTGSHNLGAYEMPVNIPVLGGGGISFAVTAGIYDNGVVNAPVKYPFYAPDTFTIQNALPGHVYHHKPTYTYYSYTQTAVMENFDADNQFTNMTQWSNAADSNVYEGLGSGAIILSSTADSLTATQTNGVVITTNGREAYMELNYRLPNVNTLLDVGVIATLPSTGATTVFDKLILTNPVGIWNKVYINFNTEIGANPGLSYQIFLTGYHQTNASHTGPQDTVFVDNVKLLYFH
jgi:hypothetical protein